MMRYILISALLTCFALESYAQADSLATVHFYSFAPEQSVKKTFNILKDNERLATEEEGGEVMLTIEPGSYQFNLEPGTGSISLTLQAGVVYFMLCTAEGTFIRRTQSEGESDLKRIRGN